MIKTSRCTLTIADCAARMLQDPNNTIYFLIYALLNDKRRKVKKDQAAREIVL